jgi:hypothetical protein
LVEVLTIQGVGFWVRISGLYLDLALVGALADFVDFVDYVHALDNVSEGLPVGIKGQF